MNYLLIFETILLLLMSQCVSINEVSVIRASLENLGGLKTGLIYIIKQDIRLYKKLLKNDFFPNLFIFVFFNFFYFFHGQCRARQLVCIFT